MNTKTLLIDKGEKKLLVLVPFQVFSSVVEIIKTNNVTQGLLPFNESCIRDMTKFWQQVSAEGKKHDLTNFLHPTILSHSPIPPLPDTGRCHTVCHQMALYHNIHYFPRQACSLGLPWNFTIWEKTKHLCINLISGIGTKHLTLSLCFL